MGFVGHLRRQIYAPYAKIKACNAPHRFLRDLRLSSTENNTSGNPPRRRRIGTLLIRRFRGTFPLFLFLEHPTTAPPRLHLQSSPNLHIYFGVLVNKIELIQKGRVLLTPTRSVLIVNIWWAWEKFKCKGLEVRAAELAQWAEGGLWT